MIDLGHGSSNLLRMGNKTSSLVELVQKNAQGLDETYKDI